MNDAPHVLLLNPPVYDFSAFDLWVRPLNLLRLGTLLGEAGAKLQLLDCLDRFHPDAPPVHKPHLLNEYGCGNLYGEIVHKPDLLRFVPRYFKRYGLPKKTLRNALLRLSPTPKSVVVCCMMTYWYLGAVEAVETIREIFPNTFIALVGVYPILCPQHARETVRADLTVSQTSYEETAQKLTEVLELNDPKPRDYISPRYDLLSNRKALPLLTTSGCPFACDYCASPKLSSGFHAYPVDAVFENVQRAVTDYETTDFALYDDAFLINKKRHALPLLEKIVASKLSARFHSPNALHAREIDDETALLLRQSGFRTIRIGLEFSDSERQRSTGGKIYLDEFASAACALKKAGFQPNEIGAYVFIGYPGQTPEEMEATCRLVHQSGCAIKPALFAPTPGTRIWENGFSDFRFDPGDDPLLHNCSLTPWRSKTFPPEIHESLIQKINAWNAELRPRAGCP